MSAGRVLAVDAGHGPRVRRTLEAVAAWLEAGETDVAWRDAPRRDLPRGDRAARRLDDLFAATPEALVASWRLARHLERMTEPGDTVLLTDCRGAAGTFALEQAMRDPAERRRVLVAAGDGTGLAMLAIAGTLEGLGEPDVYEVDWELVAYRFADGVLTPSPAAQVLLNRLGHEATVAVVPVPRVAPPSGPAAAVHLPEPACRLSRTGEIVRALGQVLDSVPGLVATVAGGDCDDRVWEGTTWEALAGARAPLGDGVRRGGPVEAAVWVLGDPYAVPDEAVAKHRSAGGRLVVAAGSAAASLWPDAPTWSDEDSLTRSLLGDGETTAGDAPAPPAPPRLGQRPTARDRARRVSVGVPVYREVSYLDECVRSILDQQQPPHEVLLVDDGSRSTAVDAALARWEDSEDTVRVLRQPNRGVCVARNLALEQMTGDAFVFVDADDVLDPAFIDRCATALRANPSLTGAATWTEFFGAYEAVEAKPPFDHRVGRRENPIVSTCVLVDMEVRERGIRFTPDLAFLYCEDWDVWSQIAAAGGTFGLVPEPLARHRVHRASGGFRRTALAASLGRARATSWLRDG